MIRRKPILRPVEDGDGAFLDCPMEWRTAFAAFESDGIKINAFEVDRGGEDLPAYGYRIDYQNHAAVLSGDKFFYRFEMTGCAKAPDFLRVNLGRSSFHSPCGHAPFGIFSGKVPIV